MDKKEHEIISDTLNDLLRFNRQFVVGINNEVLHELFRQYALYKNFHVTGEVQYTGYCKCGGTKLPESDFCKDCI